MGWPSPETSGIVGIPIVVRFLRTARHVFHSGRSSLRQGGLVIWRETRQENQSGHVYLGQANRCAEHLQPLEGWTGIPGLPSRYGGVAVTLSVIDGYGRHATKQIFLGQATLALFVNEGLPVGPHQEAHLGVSALLQFSLRSHTVRTA